jgi:hypothetical protein
VRVDQLMALCWKYMVPLSFICLLGTIGFMFMPENLHRVISAATLGFAVAVMVVFWCGWYFKSVTPSLNFT